MSTLEQPNWSEEVLRFWFQTLTPEQWFIKDPRIDQKITEQFFDLYQDMKDRSGDLQATTARETLATVLVLDQFSRNIFRDTVAAFATDAVALSLSQDCITKKLDVELAVCERKFLYMPFQHSEDARIQQQSVQLYRNLGLADVLDFAERHKAIIDRFGRFPHRNAALERVSTAHELAYLSQPGSGF